MKGIEVLKKVNDHLTSAKLMNTLAIEYLQVSAKHKRFLLGMYYFRNDGFHNYLAFKPGWFATGLSSEEMKSPGFSLAPEVIWFNVSRLVLIQ